MCGPGPLAAPVPVPVPVLTVQCLLGTSKVLSRTKVTFKVHWEPTGQLGVADGTARHRGAAVDPAQTTCRLARPFHSQLYNRPTTGDLSMHSPSTSCAQFELHSCRCRGDACARQPQQPGHGSGCCDPPAYPAATNRSARRRICRMLVQQVRPQLMPCSSATTCLPFVTACCRRRPPPPSPQPLPHAHPAGACAACQGHETGGRCRS